MRLTKQELHKLMMHKLSKAGLSEEHASIVSDVLAHADARGAHSHGAMRVEYYAERISKGGTNTNPNFKFEITGPCSAVFDGDNAAGHVCAKLAMDEAIKIAKENGLAVVGVRRMGHSGALSYYVQQAAKENMIAIAVCQSDPMCVPFGGTESYYGTNPIAFAAPSKSGRFLMMDMATTVQSWGKILHARTKNIPIEEGCAVDKDGNATTDPFKVNALTPIAGPKGYALQMMVDVLSGILLGLPFGKQVTSMYSNLKEGRDLGQLNIVINPSYFTNLDSFLEDIDQTMDDLSSMKPAKGFESVKYPGQSSMLREEDYEKNGIEIVDDVYEYLISNDIHYDRYDSKNAFAVN